MYIRILTAYRRCRYYQLSLIVREDQSRGLVVMGQIYDAGMGYRLLYARELPSSLGFDTSGVPAVYLLPVPTQ